MNHPTKQQVQTVIDTFLAVKQKGIEQGVTEFPVSMALPYRQALGFKMCHALYYGHNYNLGFLESIEKMAYDLGFSRWTSLPDWAHENPEIWGNSNGASMFGSSIAFDKISSSKLSLDSFIDHWKGVQSRLPE